MSTKQIKYKKLKIGDNERLWNQESTLVFKSQQERIVIGRFDGKEYIHLDEKTLELCEQYNFKCDPSLVEEDLDLIKEDTSFEGEQSHLVGESTSEGGVSFRDTKKSLSHTSDELINENSCHDDLEKDLEKEKSKQLQKEQELIKQRELELEEEDKICNITRITYKNIEYNLHEVSNFVLFNYKVIGKYDKSKNIINILTNDDITNINKYGFEYDLLYLPKLDNDIFTHMKDTFLYSVNNILEFYDNELKIRNDNINIQENEIFKLSSELDIVKMELDSTKMELDSLRIKLNNIKSMFG
jgi:hypothetical protein